METLSPTPSFPPPSSPRRGRFVARVIRNEAICTEHFRLTLGLQNFPPSLPGQFIQLNCNDDLEGTAANILIPHELEWLPPPNASRPTIDNQRSTIQDP